MLSPDDVLAADGRLAARLTGWESRPQQLAMARAVEARALLESARGGVGIGVWDRATCGWPPLACASAVSVMLPPV